MALPKSASQATAGSQQGLRLLPEIPVAVLDAQLALTLRFGLNLADGCRILQKARLAKVVMAASSLCTVHRAATAQES